jgi:hypothetical protein
MQPPTARPSAALACARRLSVAAACSVWWGGALGCASSPAADRAAPPPTLDGQVTPGEAVVELPDQPAWQDLVADASAPADGAPASPAPTAPATDRRPRIGSIKWYTFIWEKPSRPRGTLAVGGIRIGTSAPLKSLEPVRGENCSGKWYALDPHGFVCSDATTTFDLTSPYFLALASLAPAPGPYPYRYAFSTGSPMYARVPTPHEQQQAELVGFGPRNTFTPLGKWSEGHELLVDKDPSHVIQPTDEPPPFIKGNEPIAGSPWHPSAAKVRVIPAGSGFAYARAFKASGRTWLLTPDLYLIPADRAFAYRPNTHRGVELGKGDEPDKRVSLPLAWVRSGGEPRRRRQGEGVFAAASGSWGNKTFVQLTGRTERVGKAVYHQTREAEDIWMAETDGVSVVTRVERLHPGIGADERWLEARLIPGVMTAYEGTTPLWTSMWSGGVGGVPIRGRSNKKYATTELGVFSFQWKDSVATMSPDLGTPTVQWFAEVPHIQYVKAPLALHTSYWHDNFGHLMSAECLNVSPADSAWLFDFTEPRLPEGWSAVAPSPTNGRATRIHIKAY